MSNPAFRPIEIHDDPPDAAPAPEARPNGRPRPGWPSEADLAAARRSAFEATGRTDVAYLEVDEDLPVVVVRWPTAREYNEFVHGQMKSDREAPTNFVLRVACWPDIDTLRARLEALPLLPVQLSQELETMCGNCTPDVVPVRRADDATAARCGMPLSELGELVHRYGPGGAAIMTLAVDDPDAPSGLSRQRFVVKRPTALTANSIGGAAAAGVSFPKVAFEAAVDCVVRPGIEELTRLAERWPAIPIVLAPAIMDLARAVQGIRRKKA